MKKLVPLIFFLLALPFLSVLTSCDHKSPAWNTMDMAESLMNSRPDSAYSILSLIDKNMLSDEEERARYALLMSMALDKNYIDTTTFDVLQPAIDFYLKHGTADEQMRTLYYQGIIYLNQSDFDNAMQSFLKAEDFKNECVDSITYANLLVAQGSLYAKSCQTENYVSNNLRAARLYRELGNSRREFSSIVRALDGCISLGNKIKSDSLMSIADSLEQMHPELDGANVRVKMTYGIRFDSDDVIGNLLDSLADYTQYDDETKLDITLAYLKRNEPGKAKLIFELISPNSPYASSFRYMSAKPRVFEATQEYLEALDAYKDFHSKVESENSKIYSQKTTVAQELHELKINHLCSLQRKDKQIWIGLCMSLVFIIITGVVYYQYRVGKTKRILSEKEQTRLQLENDNLQAKNKVLELESKSTKLEREKQLLANENMVLRISQLEDESESLRNLLEKAELSQPILDAIQERIGMLNGLFAAHITADNSYSEQYHKWVSEVTADKDKFINSTRLAFWASHPKFMKYLDSRGLTESELNYVCLYAIGLLGKEVGEYIQIKRHYHISSDVRKKLGLKDNDTNLGLYIKKLMKDL